MFLLASDRKFGIIHSSIQQECCLRRRICKVTHVIDQIVFTNTAHQILFPKDGSIFRTISKVGTLTQTDLSVFDTFLAFSLNILQRFIQLYAFEMVFNIGISANWDLTSSVFELRCYTKYAHSPSYCIVSCNKSVNCCCKVAQIHE